MPINSLNPYLNFNGTAERAIALYESALGAKLDTMLRAGEIPGSDFAPEHRARVMHAQLRIGDKVLMLGDTMPGMPVQPEGNVQVCLNFADEAELTQTFDKLAVGGKVTFPLHVAFWGSLFGMLTDAFGVRWMFTGDPRPR